MEFEEIYTKYFTDVYLFVLAMSRNPDIAEEITQETFFKALKNLKNFKGDCSLKTWLCQIAKNTYLSNLKKSGRFQDDDLAQTPDTMDIENLYIKKDEALSIYKVLHCLDEPYKEVFVLRVLGELAFQEIGEIFGRKEGWARVTFHRARQKIQDLLKKEV